MTVLEASEIQKIIPHRYPMLLVDRIIELEPMKRAVGIKNITMNEMQFLGHFPGDPIMPGVLMIEIRGNMGVCECKGRVDGKVACECECTFAIMDAKK